MATRIEATELAHLLDEYSASLALYASQWSQSPDDCVQEAFVELARQTQRPENPVGWLFKTVRHRAFNASRSHQRRKFREQAAAKTTIELADPSNAMQASDEQRKLLKTLGGLPDDQRELIALRIWSGLTWDEIGEMTGRSSSSAHRHYVSALETMKKRLEEKCLTKPE